MQPQPDGPMKPIVSLIGNPSVQRELDLAGPQLKGVKEALEGIKGTFMPKIEALQKLPENQKAAAQQALMRELLAAAEAALSKVLRADQFQRFRQLRLQGEGIAVFLQEAVRAQLALSDEQGQKIRELIHNGMRRIEALYGGQAGDAAGRIVDIQDAVTQEIVQLFSEAQAATWAQMLGEKFDLGPPPPAPGAAPGPSGGPGSRGPGGAGPGAGNDPFSWG